MSELPVIRRVQAGTGWVASRGAGDRTWAQNKRLGPPQAGPQLFLHLALESASLLSFRVSSLNQFNPPGKLGKMSQDLQLQEMFVTIPNLIRVHSLLLGSTFRENPQPLFLFLFPLPPQHQTFSWFKFSGRTHDPPGMVGIGLGASLQAQRRKVTLVKGSLIAKGHVFLQPRRPR